MLGSERKDGTKVVPCVSIGEYITYMPTCESLCVYACMYLFLNISINMHIIIIYVCVCVCVNKNIHPPTIESSC